MNFFITQFFLQNSTTTATFVTHFLSDIEIGARSFFDDDNNRSIKTRPIHRDVTIYHDVTMDLSLDAVEGFSTVDR